MNKRNSSENLDPFYSFLLQTILLQTSRFSKHSNESNLKVVATEVFFRR